MYFKQNYTHSGLITIKPKVHVVNYMKNNSFFSKIIGYNNNIKIQQII